MGLVRRRNHHCLKVAPIGLIHHLHPLRLAKLRDEVGRLVELWSSLWIGIGKDQHVYDVGRNNARSQVCSLLTEWLLLVILHP